MSTWKLGWGIFWRIVAQGAGYGTLLGGIYGLLYTSIDLLFNTDHPSSFERIIGGICLGGQYGFTFGMIFGCLWGLFVGLVSGFVVALIGMLVLPEGILVRRFDVLVGLLSLGPIGLSLSPIARTLTGDSSEMQPIIFGYALPALIAAWAFWRIGGSVTNWVHAIGSSITAEVDG